MRAIATSMTLVAILLLAACTTPEEKAARLAAIEAADRQECTRLGFTPGSEAFADCLLKLREIRAQEENTRAIKRSSLYGPAYPFHHPFYHRGFHPFY